MVLKDPTYIQVRDNDIQILRKYCFSILLNCARFFDCLICCGNSFRNLTPESYFRLDADSFLEKDLGLRRGVEVGRLSVSVRMNI